MPVEQMHPPTLAPNNTEKELQEEEEEEERRCSCSSGSSSLNSSTTCQPPATSSADYDHIRNTTLMFFLDRLYMSGKKGAEVRTLHDLSCLFGTRGFTKEMRQIVGASRNGLKKFLQSYPSLFTVEGEQVYLTQLEQAGSSSSGSAQRDYNKEAVEYFAGKLAQFGASLVPIKNLFGYRSQASQEVRHVSGRTSREFKQFLVSQAQVFEILAGEHVVLRSALKELESRGETTESLEQTLQPQGDQLIAMDSYLNKQFAQSVCECLSRMQRQQQPTGDLHRLQDLHERIMEECSNQVFIKMVKTTHDLKLFLRMHPKLFKRFTKVADADDGCCKEVEYVRLVSEAERTEMERLNQPVAQQQQQQQNLQQVSSSHQEDAAEGCYTSLPANLNQAKVAPIRGNRKPPLTTSSISNTPTPTSEPSKQDKQMQQATSSNQLDPNGQLSSNNQQSNLRANAPAFVPSSHHLQRHTSIGGLSYGVHQGSLRLNEQRTATGGLRAALRDHLVRAEASNQSNGIYSPRKMSNGGGGTNWGLLRQHSSLTGDQLRARTIDIVREASKIISLVMNTTDRVAFDCEGYNLGFNNSHGQITLIQLAFLPKKPTSTGNDKENNNNDEDYTEDDLASGRVRPEMCVFDLLTNPELAYCLKPLLESEQIEKVMHDVRNKSNALYQQFGVMLNRVFDTQVANLVIQQQETGKPAYKSHYISMSKLCELYASEWLLKHRNSIKGKTRHSSSAAPSSNGSPSTGAGQQPAKRSKDADYWRNRPLTDAMVYEASMDVYCLMGGVYQKLKSKIKPEYVPLFQELNREGVLARIRPEEIRTVKKERKIDLEVIDLKRKLYSDSPRSIVLSNREIRLLRHVDLTDEVRQKIQQCKKVAKKLERLDMKAAQQLQQQQGHPSTASGSGSELNDSLSEQQLSMESSVDKSKQETSEDILNDITYDATAGLGNLMESSMFDELKDKMIESSSLLESLEDDDDEELALPDLTKHHHHLHHHSEQHSSGEHTSCNCQCHHSLESQQEPTTTTTNITTTATSDINELKPPENKPEEVGEEDKFSSLKSTSSSSKASSQADTQQQQQQQQVTITEPKAVDMAIQCDLLS